MNTRNLLLLFFMAVFTSCSSAYKVTQTPDDVYYSPLREVDEYQREDNRDLNNERYDDRLYGYNEWDDRRLRLSCRSRYNRWRMLDDYSWDRQWQGNNTWRYDTWTDTWYPVINCSCGTSWYSYNNWGWNGIPYFYYTPVFTTSPKPVNTIRWTNTNYNSGNYGNPSSGFSKGTTNRPKVNYSIDKPRNRTNDGTPRRGFSIWPSSGSSSGSGSSGSGSSGGGGNGRAFRN